MLTSHMQMWQSWPRDATRYVVLAGAASSDGEAAKASSSSMSVLLVDFSRAASDFCCLALLRAIRLTLQNVPYSQGAQHQDEAILAEEPSSLSLS